MSSSGRVNAPKANTFHMSVSRASHVSVILYRKIFIFLPWVRELISASSDIKKIVFICETSRVVSGVK
jgi:hypothetical protein